MKKLLNLLYKIIMKTINWISRNLKISKIKKLIESQKYAEASVHIHFLLQRYPNHPMVLRLKEQAEKGFASYLYRKEFE